MNYNIRQFTFAAGALLTAVTLTLGSCTREELGGSGDGEVAPHFTAVTVATRSGAASDGAAAKGNGAASKATGGAATRADGDLWEADEIGVMVTKSPSSDMISKYVNVQYATKATGATSAEFNAVDEGIYFRHATETVTFAAYAPYSATDDIATLPGADGVFTASTSSQGDADAQSALDFLYASGATGSQSNPDVTLNFTHVMSKIVINFKSDKDGFASTVAAGTYYIDGLTHSGSFDVNPADATVGTAYATGSAVDDWEISANCPADTDGGTAYDVSYTAIVFPQSPNLIDLSADINGIALAGLNLLSYVDGGKLEAGKSYIFNVSVTSKELTITGCTVSGWDSALATKNVDAYNENDLILTYTITDPGTKIAPPLYGTVNCKVDWGDGSDVETATSSWPTHTYTAAGEYDVVIEGTVTELYGRDINNLTAKNTTLTAVKQWGKTGLTNLIYAFYRYTALTSIPGDTAASFTDVTSFLGAFYYCSSLTSIPEDLFVNGGSAQSFQQVFFQCTSVTSIPENLFSNCLSATNFREAFEGLSLTEIPKILFANCPLVTDLESVFGGCTGLTEIPENLFSNNPAVENFSYAFYGCTGLSEIPENLFANNSAVTTFAYAFYGCNSLTEIPANLFAYNTAVTNFSHTFSGCTSLTGESAYDVIDGVETNVHLYERSSYPDIYTAPTSYTGCYSNCTSLDDYSSIPSGWGGGGN